MLYDLTLEHWDTVSDATRERLAFELASSLPTGFDLKRVERWELGKQTHFIARFSYRGAGFVLVPGGEVTLGYDPATPFSPSAAQTESWQETVNDASRARLARGLAPIDPSLENYIRAVSSPLRTINLAPFLIEVEAREAGVEPLPLDAPEVLAYTERYRDEGPGQVENGRLRVRFGSNGPIEAYRKCWKNGEECRRAVEVEGFRLPTADEFEHACRAGSRTLFRWGDDTPNDEEPNPLIEAPRWSTHRLPSAFGVSIAQNPYAHEFVMEPDVMCGGDGGHAICSGQGIFVAWLTLSSAFRSPSWGARPMPGAYYRRVLPLV